MIQSGTSKPIDDESIESDPQPQPAQGTPQPEIPQEDSPEIEETEEQPS